MKNRLAEIEKSFGAHFLMTFLCAVLIAPSPVFPIRGTEKRGMGRQGRSYFQPPPRAL